MLILSIIASRYGSGILEDNFIARIYTSYDSGSQFLALYAVLNCYIYVLVNNNFRNNSQNSEIIKLKADTMY